ncbi:DNA-binding response regulator, NarL/FixJ family, contains REC and HTH domains [Flavobacterium micromati]|uniref:DNA-binding response regulator, NarL/FixJ family, contains REC and HTH domains n=1 Tax=Flavobacterium micromati TaxID=229205 RepID=A0A1M5GJC1_9FLAO|nr:response regulator transcription factor [Flavobacterium micromati]SHG03844.1 DNA-binding response regulator, NarL/FixJ family, contains REC and HTH domains [Flavobacterium micromati]
MFQKVLVAEDLDSISIAVVQALKQISVSEIRHAKYCDDAFLQIKKALHDRVPYDLIITDLSFKIDYRKEQLTSGEELIEAVKKIQPTIKAIVFSIEDKSFRIKSLFNNLGIDAYVCKGRDSIQELQTAVKRIYEAEEVKISHELSLTLRDKTLFEIESYDISILKSLARGLTLEEISIAFKDSGIAPNGSSSLEKRINKLKVYFKANNNVHLIAISKDLGLI